MNAAEMVAASLKQSQGYLDRSLEGLTQGDIAWSPNDACNSIAFIIWHTTRVEDFFVTRVIQRQPELYEAEGWREKLGTPPDSGYGYTVDQIKGWPVPAMETVKAYADAVRKSTLAYLEQLAPEKTVELVRPDRSTDTIGGILSRVSTEVALHMGQIDYLRGLRRGFVGTEAP
jgi:hypothetical protein